MKYFTICARKPSPHGIEVGIVIVILSCSIMTDTLYLLDEYFVGLDGCLWRNLEELHLDTAELILSLHQISWFLTYLAHSLLFFFFICYNCVCHI